MLRAVEENGEEAGRETGVDVICHLPIWKAIPNDVSGAEEVVEKEATT